MGEGWRTVWGLVLLALALGALGCGGEASTGAEETAAAEERPYPNVTGPTREFIIPGGDNVVQLFGEEASSAEREAASRVIHLWMSARVAEDWATDCSYLAREYVKTLVWDARSVSEGKVTNCPEALRYFGDEASGTSGNTLTGPIDSLRVRDTITGDTEKEAFAQWHGPQEKDWILSMNREGGVWRISIAGPLDRTK